MHRLGNRRKKQNTNTVFDEHILDDIAVNSPLRNIPAGLKLFFVLFAIVISVISPEIFLPLVTAGVMIFITLVFAKVNARLYLSLLTIPLVFALTGAAVILFVTGSGETLVSFFSIGSLKIQITNGSIKLALLVLARTFAGMTSLYFLALTTPVASLFLILKKIRIPQEFIDLSMLIYRYIFVIISEAVAIHNAQKMRGGYDSWKNWIQSISMLASMLFIRAWERGDEIFTAMEARCYDGCMSLSGDTAKPVFSHVMLVLLFSAVSTAILICEMIYL